MPVAVVPMQIVAPAWIVIVKLSLSHRYKVYSFIHTSLRLPLLFPLAHPRLSEDRIMVRPRELREALFSVCNEKSSEDDRAAWMGGYCSWLSRGFVGFIWIYRFEAEKQFLPPIHDMDVRKWLFGVIWSWKRSELRLVHDPTSLTHFYVPKIFCILLFLVTRLVPQNHANHYLGAKASTDAIVVGLCQLAQRTNWRTTARSRRPRSWTQHVPSFLVPKKWILQNGAQKDAKAEFCLDVVWKLDEVI